MAVSLYKFTETTNCSLKGGEFYGMCINNDFPVPQSVKNPSTMQEITCNAGDLSSIPGSGRTLGG